MKALLKRFLLKNPGLLLKIRLVRKTTLSLYLINFVFQRIFRRQSKLKFNVNFTSSISSNNLSYHADLTTLASFSISGHCYFQSINGIQLGKNCLFAAGVKLISSNHSISDFHQAVASPPIIIGDDCWLGANVIILPGVQIGNGCVIGAGSIVTKSFGDGLVIAGNPAKILKRIDDK